jgi:hypothetical protein
MIRLFFLTIHTIVKRAKYPIAELYPFWSWKWDNSGSVKYSHSNTL